MRTTCPLLPLTNTRKSIPFNRMFISSVTNRVGVPPPVFWQEYENKQVSPRGLQKM
jgi:hypothetical protein